MNHISKQPMTLAKALAKGGGITLPTVLSDSTSIYLQIANLIEENILRGILLEEEQAPSTNELSRLYSINPATAAKGLNLLVDEGILYKKRGLGMFVTEGAKRMIQEKRRGAFFEGFVEPLISEAKKLGISAEELSGIIQAVFLKKEDGGNEE